jgi:PPR repeat family
MRYNWSTTTSTVLRKFHCYVTAPHVGHGARHSHISESATRTMSSSCSLFREKQRNTTMERRQRIHHSGPPFRKVMSTSVRPDNCMTTFTPSTDAQVSRAAAMAVRISVRTGEIADAYYILNSLQWSPNITPPHKMGLARHINVPHRPFIPLQFSPSVSARLAAHSLLHELLRVGLATKAYRLAETLMGGNMKIRPRSLDAVMHGLLAQGATAPGIFESHRLDRITTILTSAKVLSLQPQLIEDQSTRYAIRLILRARHHRQRCTSEAYHSIIRYLLQRAEILIASLLFCTLVKDYQLKHTMAARLRGQIRLVDTDGESQQSTADRKADLQARLKGILWQKGVVDKRLAMSLVDSIEKTMLQDPQQDSDEVSLRMSLQALANIAMLLDERQIPFPEVASIIRALYSCPKSKRRVWIVRNGRPHNVEAYSYFHSVLMRLSSDLPSTVPLRRLGESDPNNSPLPPLDLASYNSLLHYALRHRHDLALAKKVLCHMKDRPRPLEPNIVTYNILIRSGTLLRKNHISEEALASLRRYTGNAQHGIMVTSSTEDTPTEPIPDRAKAHETPSHWDVMGSVPILPSNPLTADGYTLTSYIMHLTSTGRPHIVADILFHVLPELSMIDHLSWDSLTPNEAMALRKSHIESRHNLLRRVASFGPHFFVAILNALCKSGKTGLTERVWFLAKQAERLSWMVDDISPWLLNVHAYTIMLQCYAAEARKGLAVRRTTPSEDQQYDWKPLSNQQVRGWAGFFVSRRTVLSASPRRSAARQMGMLLYRSMRNSAEAISQDLVRLKIHAKADLHVPKPDARFFNAALKLFVHKRHPARVQRWQLKRRLRVAQRLYARSGIISQNADPVVQMIIREMIENGFPPPIGLRRKLVGRMSSLVFRRKHHQPLDRSPFAFPRVRNIFRPYTLPTIKTRGLPVSRSKSRRHRWTSHSHDT